MANSSAVSSGDLATADQYNNLRTDVLSTHDHDGTNGTATVSATTFDGAATVSANWGFTGTVTVGVDDTGKDVKFFGATSGQYLLWDESADELVLAGDTKLSFHDAAGGENIIASANGHLEINSGTTLDMTAPTVALNSSTEFNIDTAAYDLNASGAVTIDAAGLMTVTGTNNATGTIYLRANAGTSETLKIHSDQGTSVTEGAESVTILSDAGGVGIRSTANLAKAINITSDGGTTGSIAIFNDQGTSVTEGQESISLLSDAGGIGIRSTANLANAVNITVDGGTTSSMTLFNDQGTGATEGSASIQLLSDVGGINIKSGLDGANAILLTADGGTSETIKIHADQGTSESSIQLLSDAGGVDINAATGKDVDVAGGTVNVTSSDDAASAIYLRANAGTSETIKIHADQGSGESSIQLLSDAGGVDINAATGKEVDIAGGTVNLSSSDDAAAAIYLRANAGTSETIKIHADQGTSVTEGQESINILSDAGGVGIRSTANLANAVNITVDGGTSSTMTLFNDQGTSVTEGAESIALLSDAGGIGIRSTANLANAVNVTVDGGTSSTMTLFNDQGTAATEGAASIQLLSDVGGINIKSGLNGAGAILLTADGGTSETIVLHADQGSGAGSIELVSDAGGITFTANGTITHAANTDLGTNSLTFSDITLSRGAANRLDLASGDSLKIIAGDITVTDGSIQFQAGDGRLKGDGGANDSLGWTSGDGYFQSRQHLYLSVDGAAAHGAGSDKVFIETGGVDGAGSTVMYFDDGGAITQYTNSAVPGTGSGATALYVVGSGGDAELTVKDGSGNTSTLSPHNNDNGEWWFNSKNAITGRVFKVHMEKLVKFIDKQFGTDFVQEYMEEADE